jgi:hypothetical protein
MSVRVILPDPSSLFPAWRRAIPAGAGPAPRLLAPGRLILILRPPRGSGVPSIQGSNPNVYDRA